MTILYSRLFGVIPPPPSPLVSFPLLWCRFLHPWCRFSLWGPFPFGVVSPPFLLCRFPSPPFCVVSPPLVSPLWCRFPLPPWCRFPPFGVSPLVSFPPSPLGVVFPPPPLWFFSPLVVRFSPSPCGSFLPLPLWFVSIRFHPLFVSTRTPLSRTPSPGSPCASSKLRFVFLSALGPPGLHTPELQTCVKWGPSGGARKVEGPKFRAFFLFSRHNFHSSFPLLGSSRGTLVVSLKAGTLKCAR